LGILIVGIVGTAAELVLLEHWEDPWQYTPLVVLGLGMLVTIFRALSPRPWNLRALRWSMAIFVAAGMLGLNRHYIGNVEFELEIYPSMVGFELFWKAITGATPALAPGALVLLGLIGLASAHGDGQLNELRD